MSDLIQRLLTERPWLLADGATGTNFFARGLETGEAPEIWNFEDRIRSLRTLPPLSRLGRISSSPTPSAAHATA
jgi:hypothetical protein